MERQLMPNETASVTPPEYLKGIAAGRADMAGEISLLNAVIRETQGLLSEALDLCVRGRKLDQVEGIGATPWLWTQEQYDKDLSAWEDRARRALS